MSDGLKRKLARFNSMPSSELRFLLASDYISPDHGYEALAHQVLREREEKLERERFQAQQRTALWSAAATLGNLFVSVAKVFLPSG